MTSTDNLSLALAQLVGRLRGTLQTGDLIRHVYATDASAYQELPLAVAIPRTENDLVELIVFAREHGVGLIPRTAGTSLAGQVVGSGIVVDVSKHFTQILEINRDESWVRLQPGVIRNELNQALQPHGLLFGPETSTQNRAMLGGMLGNNSCGSNSIRYGSTRDHVLEVTALLADGTKVVFGALSSEEFKAKCEGPETLLETRLYRDIRDSLSDAGVRDRIRDAFPKPSIPRRNTGYALDLLMDACCFDSTSEHPFHFGKLIAGSEGTLCFVTEMKLHCNPLPPPAAGLQCAQFESVQQALQATQIAVQHNCYACELIDDHILECTRRSLEHRQNRFFLEGEPKAVLVTELRGETVDEVTVKTDQLAAEMKAAGLGYAFPLLVGAEMNRVWELRKAGLGLMSNTPGDSKPVPVIEDTAVDVADLPAFIAEIDRELEERYGLTCVHYAHAGSGEIHLRPIINLKTSEGHQRFRDVAQLVAGIVKKYRGSLSGEHGDGRLRGEFLREMIGDENYELAARIKRTWDPHGVFNPGKIIDTPAMNTFLRYRADVPHRDIETVFDWSSTLGVLRAAEMCNGSGDCRKTHHSGGTMCPSYMATRNEQDTTRARANMLRHVLSNPTGANAFDDDRLKEVLDLCLSCKGCKSECPSTVDMAKLKAEFQQQYQDVHGVPLRSRLIAGFARSQAFAAFVPWLWNAIVGSAPARRVLNRLAGFHPERSLPTVSPTTFSAWFADHERHPNAGQVGRVWLFCDEFTNYSDVPVGIAAVELLERLGYAVDIPMHRESGRSSLSKGLIREAKQIIDGNVRTLARVVTEARPLIGLEPSALLTFRDEAIDLAEPDGRDVAQSVASNSYLLEEFLVRERAAGRIDQDQFTKERAHVLVHGHCFQKALVGVEPTVAALRLPENFQVDVIPSGCCGMAGSFGYEREHFEISQDIANLVLVPAIQNASEGTIIAASGTSCRHQIHDSAQRSSKHPAVILREALRER